MLVDNSLSADAFKFRVMVSDDIMALLALLDIKIIGYHIANKAHILELSTLKTKGYYNGLEPMVISVKIENGDKQWREFITELVSCIKANDIARIIKISDTTFSERF